MPIKALEQFEDKWNSGARWHRWEPHVHAPGTILNDQFAGPEKMGKLSSLFRYERVAETARAGIKNGVL